MHNLVKNIQNFAHQNELWKKSSKIVVGVSGGADSVCLLHILIYLAKRYDFSLHIAHVNYGLRGKDSLSDEKFVEALAEKNGIGFSCLQVEKIQGKANLESKLRKIRYDFFETVRGELKFDFIAIAHNQDDQAETVLMRLMRGSGLEGFSAIKAKNGSIVRPLLSTSRAQIMHYLNEQEIKYRIDKTNLEPLFSRNKIRLKLIPFLEKNFNPAIKEALANFAQTAGDDFSFIDGSARKACKFVKISDRAAQFEVNKMLSLHPSIQRQCIRQIIREIKNDLFDIESAHLREIEKILKSTKSKSHQTSFKGLKIARKGAMMSLLCEIK